MLEFVLPLLLLLPTQPGAGLRLDAYGDPLPPGAVARLGSVRWRCPDPPDHLVWSPDGKHLVGTHGGRSLTIWAYPSGVVTGRFQVPGFVDPEAELPVIYKSSPTLTPDQVQFATDSQSMFVYGGQNQLYRVSVPDGRSQLISAGGPDGMALAVTADGRCRLLEDRIACVIPQRWSDLVLDKGVFPTRSRSILSRQTHAPSRRIHGPLLVASGTAMSPDGRFVLAGVVENDTERLTAIDLLNGQQWFFDARRGGEPMFLPGGRAFLTRDLHRLTRWDLFATNPDRPTRLTRRAEVELDPDRPPVQSMAVAPDGRHCVLVHDWARLSETAFTLLDAVTLRTIRTWSVAVDSDAVRERANIRHWITERTDSRTAVAVAPDGRTVAVASLAAPLVQFFNLETGTEIVHHGGHGERVGHLLYRPEFWELVSGSADKVARTWDVESLRTTDARRLAAIREAETQPNFDLRELQLQTGRRKLVYESGRYQIRDRETEEVIRELPETADEPTHELGGEPRTAVSADDWWCAYRAGDQIMVHDQDSGLRVTAFRVEGSWPTALEFIQGTDLLVAGYHDGQILIWRVRPLGVPDRQPTSAELDRAWADLGGDAAAAVRGRATLLAQPADSLAWLKDPVRPIPHPTEYDIDLWLARLAHRRFAVREEASRLLARHFDVAEKPIREVLAVTKSPEIEHRLRGLLASQTRGADAESVRLNRLVVILERMGTPDARELLFRIARGAGVPAVRATDALERLTSRLETRPDREAKAAVVTID